MSHRSARIAAALAGLAVAALVASCGAAPATIGNEPAPVETTSHGPTAQPSGPASTSEPPASDKPSREPSAPPSTEKPSGDPTPTKPTKPAKPKPTKPSLKPGKTLWQEGSQGDKVRELQARLKQIGWFDTDVTGYYGPVTAESIRGFQAKREIPVTGKVDQRTWDRLVAMTRQPTADEKADRPPAKNPGTLDERCLTGKVMCVDKSTNTLSWVVNGKVVKVLDARFGCQGEETREGVFSVGWKSRDHVSTIYGSAMPFAMFFSGGQAVHYSSDFAARGWNGCSHGCVNIRDRAGIEWLFDQVAVGDKVVVHW